MKIKLDLYWFLFVALYVNNERFKNNSITKKRKK